ncbi:unnamed protein product [Schistosoma intercalatum]|nr:unnamed protein product [Schistosoma intercalatum]
MCSSISCNNDQNTAELSANRSENFTSRRSVNRSTALSDDMTNSSTEINIYSKAFCIKQPDHMPSSSFTCTALSSTVTV